MKKEYDFSRGKRGPAIPSPGKTRITIYLDNVTLARFKSESEQTGKGYQTLINEALAKNLKKRRKQLRDTKNNHLKVIRPLNELADENNQEQKLQENHILFFIFSLILVSHHCVIVMSVADPHPPYRMMGRDQAAVV